MILSDWLFAIILVSPVFGVLLGFILAYTEKNGLYTLYSILYGIFIFTIIHLKWINVS